MLAGSAVNFDDLTKFRDEVCEDDESIFKELLDSFLGGLTEYKTHLVKFFENAAETTLSDTKNLAHKLKSTSRYLGAEKLAEKLEFIESCPDDEFLEQKDKICSELICFIDEVIVEMTEYKKKL